ncbi:MAG TPA: DegT/DnrJ/EryC1/StrS family aminotransferase [Acidobacteriaceae bacterium]|jgi:perosamine synthetase|nr:DegT/DnrJ/EryC1/StrS family aminotransferase [Acidobacteriaceae bacterium]
MMEIPLSGPDIVEADIEAVTAVLRTSRLSLGTKLNAFEAAMASYTGVPRAVAVSSGTAALHLSLLALGIQPGDEVIVPSFTFIAVANAIRYVGAQPVFADIDAESLNLSPGSVEAAITPRTRALIVVHTFGRPAELADLLSIAQRHNLRVVEDASEAIGAEVNGRRVGSFGDTGVFAFYPNKQITTGEGGIVVTRDSKIAERIAALRNQGRYPSPPGSDPQTSWFDHAELGYNYRIGEMECALGLSQLARIDAILARREAIARRYCELLAGTPGLVLPATDVPNQRLSWFVFVVRLAEDCAADARDRLMASLAATGIATGRYFAPIHLQPAYAAWRESADLPVTEAVASRSLALPFFNGMTDAEIVRVGRELQAALRAQR